MMIRHIAAGAMALALLPGCAGTQEQGSAQGSGDLVKQVQEAKDASLAAQRAAEAAQQAAQEAAKAAKDASARAEAIFNRSLRKGGTPTARPK